MPTTPRPRSSSRSPKRFGIDIGGTGIKGAPVDLRTGKLLAERVRILTPQPSRPEAVADVVAEVVASFGWRGPVGCTFPGVVKRGVVLTAANVDKGWVDLDADALLTERLGMDVHMLNDADAAGIAEVRYGAAKGVDGVVLLVTIGTGLGTALFVDGTLVPNTEFGHIELGGEDAEARASERTRVEKDLGWKKYGRALDEYLGALERYLNPDLIVLGGGGSEGFEKFGTHLRRSCPVVVAALGNDAGIVGAAMEAGAAG